MMKVRLLDDILTACDEYNIIPDKGQGFTEVCPSVIMFYAVRKDCPYRQMRYLAVLYPNNIVIEPYGNQTF